MQEAMGGQWGQDLQFQLAEMLVASSLFEFLMVWVCPGKLGGGDRPDHNPSVAGL